MSLANLDSNEKLELKKFFDEGQQVMNDIEELRQGLKDSVKAYAERLDVKPAILNRALKIAYKRSLSDDTETWDQIQAILDTVGHRA